MLYHYLTMDYYAIYAFDLMAAQAMVYEFHQTQNRFDVCHEKTIHAHCLMRIVVIGAVQHMGRGFVNTHGAVESSLWFTMDAV